MLKLLIGGGTWALVLAALYYIVKMAVKNGMTEAYEEITGKNVKDGLGEILESEAAEKGSKLHGKN